MKKMSFEEMKDVQLYILDEFHSWCNQHDIKYSLSFGTLLGAIRHRGYIPWDDDIDLMMLREDYKRLINDFNKNAPKYLRLRSHETDKTYFTPFAKVEDIRTYQVEEWAKKYDIGVNIDIFPVDAIPSTKAGCYWLFLKKSFLEFLLSLKLSSLKNRKKSLLKKMVIVLSHIGVSPIPLSFLASKLNSFACNDDTTSDKIMILVSDLKSVDKAFSRKAFESLTEVEFEGRKYNALSGYKEYLTATYGDYMRLPPEQDRVSHHYYTPYWK